MSAKIVELSQKTETQLLKAIANSLTRTEALAELERREQVAVSLATAAKAEALKVINAALGKVTTREAVMAYLHISLPKAWYGADTHPLVGLREALYTYLKAEGLNLDSHAIREWLANN